MDQTRVDKRRQAERDSNLCHMAIWNRANENARKLALLYACSENHVSPEIDAAAASWAQKVVTYMVKRQLYMVSIHSAESDFHRLCLRVCEKLRSVEGGALTRSEISRKMKLKSRELTEVLEALEEQNYVHRDTKPTEGRSASLYRLL